MKPRSRPTVRRLPLTVLSFFLISAAAQADVVHLKKSDENLTGKVIDDGSDTLRVEIKNGALQIKKSEVEWIVYGTDKEIEDKRLAAGFFEKGWQKFSAQDFDAAALQFQRALELVPEDANLLNNIGACYARLKNYPVAISAYEKALKANRNHATASLNLAQAYIETEAYRKAERILRKRAVKGANDQLTYVLLGVVFYKNNRYTHAISSYNKALYMEEAVSPLTADIYNNLGCSHAKLLQLQDAEYAYEKALEVRPSHYLANQNRTVVRQAKEKLLAKAAQ